MFDQNDSNSDSEKFLRTSTSIVEKEDEILFKHVNAIAFMPVKGGKRISLMGRKLFNVLLHQSMSEPEKMEHEFSLSEIIIKSSSGGKNNNYGQIKDTLKELMTTTVEWQSPSKNEFVDIWDACNLLSGVSLMKNKKTGAITVKWRFDYKIRENILRPEIYSRLSLDSITQFSTHSAMALYEICARYVNNPSHLTARQNWKTWWKPVLTGVSTDPEKADYRFFKRDVLKKAIAEVNAKTNLQIDGPIEFKEANNRTVVDIQFEVNYKKINQKQPLAPTIKFSANDLPIIGRAISLGLTQKEAERFLNKYSSEMFDEGLNELEKRIQMPSEKVGEVKKKGLWLKSTMDRISLKNDLPPVIHLSESEADGNEKLSKKRAEWNKNWLKIEKEKLTEYFENISEEEKQEKLKKFAEYLENNNKQILLEKFKGLVQENKMPAWKHRMISATFIEYLGITQKGAGWDKPTAEDLLAIAAKEIGAI